MSARAALWQRHVGHHYLHHAVVTQVIDARDPLTYRSSDLEDYARDISRHKGSMLLLNKSDLLPEART